MKIITTIIALLVFIICLNAQPIPPTAPSASSMNYLSYISSNQDLSNGTDNISYPITTVVEGPLSHSVGIQYNTGGVRVSTVASQVGLGWNLSGGGMISRLTRGIPDDEDDGWLNLNSTPTDEEIASGEKDGEPDLYRFNAGSFSGTFTFDNANNVHTIPKSNIWVQPIYFSSWQDQIGRFIITDEYGTKYYFGADPNGDDYLELMSKSTHTWVNDLNCSEDDRIISGWFLYKIESYDGNHTIQFEYERHGYQSVSLASQGKLKYYDCTSNSSGESDLEYYGNDNDYGKVFSTNAISTWIIKKISTTSTEVLFENKNVSDGANYSRDDLAEIILRHDCDSSPITFVYPSYLESIQVNSLNTAHCVEYELNLSYFEDDGPDNHTWTYDPWTKKRLKLDEIKKVSCDPSSTDEENPTTFEYYGTDANGNSFFPRYLSTGVDHNGFFNDQNSTTTNLIEPSSFTGYCGPPLSFGSGNRTPDLEATKKGVLQKINFPTGGYKEYVYDLNHISEQSSTSGLFDLHPCQIWPICCGVSSSQSTATIHITPGIKNNGKLWLYLEPLDPTSCSWTNSYIQIEAFEAGTLEYTNSINIAISNYTGPEFIEIPLIDINEIIEGHDYVFTASAENANTNSYVYLNDPSNFTTISVPGLRLSSIKLHDGFDSNKDIIKTFNYDKFSSNPSDPESSGILYYPENNYVTGTFNPSPDISQAWFFMDPSFPLYNFFGSHITYQNVTVENNGEGKTQYTFETPNIIYNFDYLQEPSQYDNTIGFVKNTKFIEEITDNVLQETDQILKNDYLEVVENPRIAKEISVYDGSSIQDDHVIAVTYHLKTGLSRIEQVVTDLDGFETTVDYEYFSGNDQYQVWKSTMINSDGKEIVTRRNYTDNYWWGNNESGNQNENDCLKNEFNYKNIRNVLWFTETEVDNVIVDGKVTEYKLFNSSGQHSGVTCSDNNNPNKYLRQFKKHRIERSWDNNGNIYPISDYWEEQMTYDEYTVDGLLERTSRPGWTNVTQYYYDLKRLDKIQFGTQETQFEYFGDSHLIKKKTDPNGQSESYEYDGLNRLSKTTVDCNGVFTTYDYFQTNGSSSTPDNKIVINTDFTPGCPSGNCGWNNTYSNVSTIESIQYLDGLGRTVQTIGVKHEPDNEPGSGSSDKDIIHAYEYDNHGRKAISYLPQLSNTSNNNGNYVIPDPNNWLYTETNYEESPLSRVENVDPAGSLPGSNTYFESNTSSDAVLNIEGGGNYSPGTLKKIRTRDANDIETIIFSDRLGRKVLYRTRLTDASTYDEEIYYLYDDKNRLKTVIPEGASLSTPDLIFEYTYYGDDQIQYKKIPGADEIYVINNDQGIPSLYQDGNLKNNNEYLATNYDGFGRKIKTGKVTITNPPANESFSDWPISSSEELSNYTFSLTTHNLTQSSERILGTNDFITSNFFYDSCNRLQRSESNSQLDLSNPTSYKVENYYNQTSDIKEVKTTLDINGSINVFQERFWYDYEGRNNRYLILPDGGGPDFTNVSRYFFNEEEEIYKKYLGLGLGGQNPWLQYIDYTYTDWGSLETINSGGTKGSEIQIEDGYPTFSSQSSINDRDLFSMRIYYNDGVDLTGNGTNDNQNYQDGSISAIRWQTRGRREQAYTFNYNYEYQLLNADFFEQNESATNNNFTKTVMYSTDYTYTDRGLITDVSREGLEMIEYYDPPLPDPFFNTCTSTVTISYLSNSNQIDTRGGYGICTAYQIPQSTYTYDNNGNVINNPFFENITYNHLNLIEGYDEDGQSNYLAVYTSSGNKIKEDNTDFIGRFELINGNINKIHYLDGFLDSYSDRNYYISDYLGNARIVFKDADGDNKIESIDDVVQEYHYYPFGLKLNGPWLGSSSNSIREQYNGIDFKKSKIYDGAFMYADIKSFGLNHATFRSLDPSIGQWLQIDPYTEGFYSMSPYNSMGNNPIMYSDPDGDFIAQIVGGVVGAGVNVFSNWDKIIANPWSAIGYVASGAVGGVVATVNPALGKSIAAAGNVATDIASGNVPSFDSFEDVAAYGSGIALDAFSVGGAGKIGNIAQTSLRNAAKQGTREIALEVLGSGAFGQDLVYESSLDIINDVGKVTFSFGDVGVKPIISSSTPSLLGASINTGLGATLSNGITNSSQLPDKTIINQDGIKVEHYYRSGDHGPAHAHVKGGGPETRIGQNGHPLKGNPELTSQQRKVIMQTDNRRNIRKTLKKIMKWHRKLN